MRSLRYCGGGATCFTTFWLCVGGGLREGTVRCLASGGLPGTYPVSSHFTHSPYVTGTLPAVALVLNPRVGGLVYILRLCSPFKWSFLKIWQFLMLSQPPRIFTDRNYGDLPSQRWNPRLCGLAWGWDPSLSRYPS